jgi:hypothetical protein
MAVPLPPAKLRHGVGRRRRERANNPARACHLISSVHLGSDGLTSIKLTRSQPSKSDLAARIRAIARALQLGPDDQSISPSGR